MAEAVYNASGLGLPIVMTVGNRAIGSPINIWNDQSDSMALRDSGSIQLFVEDNQQTVDVHIQAFRLAEALSLPVMVCMDGFILTHAFEQVDMPTQEQIDRFLPPYSPMAVPEATASTQFNLPQWQRKLSPLGRGTVRWPMWAAKPFGAVTSCSF
jgi:pyruvate ferredoxin oxidoreductase alpha subunit